MWRRSGHVRIRAAGRRRDRAAGRAPEDCGGVWGLEELIAEGELVESGFDPDTTNALLAHAGPNQTRPLRMAGASDEPASGDAVARLWWLLRRLGTEGVILTGAGYLPPAVVREAFESWRLADGEWIGEGNRESLTLPVLEIKEWARELGLVRKYRAACSSPGAGSPSARNVPALRSHVAAHEAVR